MKTNWLSLVRSVLKRVFIRFWVAPFYILVTFPYVALATEFGNNGETNLYRIVNTINGHFGSAGLIDENDIIRATAILFIIMNLVAELLRLVSKRATNYQTGIFARTTLCVGGWILCALVVLVQGKGLGQAFPYVVIGLVSVIPFLIEFSLYKTFSTAFTKAAELGTMAGKARRV